MLKHFCRGDTSYYHALGNAVFAFLQAILTLEQVCQIQLQI